MKMAYRFAHSAAVAALGITAADIAGAQYTPLPPTNPLQGGPYYVGVSQAFTHDTNVFRVPIGQRESSDTYSTTSLLAGFDKPISRQRLYGDAIVRHNRYRDNDQLNNTGYGVDVGIDWETVQSLSGRVGYTVKENLAKYGADTGPVLTTKNLERTQEFLARGQYGGASLLALEAAYVHRRLDYSAPEFAFQEFNQDSGRLGLLYRPSGALTLGIGGRHTKGEYPAGAQPAPGVFVADEFNRNDVDLTAVWVATGQSTVRARLSYTKEKHDVVTARNLSSSTGSIGWDYKPTAKLSFNADYIRDTGAETAFFTLGQTGASGSGTATGTAANNGVGNYSALSDTVAVRGVYEVTAKVQVEVLGRYVERDLVNTGGAGPANGTDRYGEAKVGVTWMPTRSLTFGCGAGREKRGSTSVLSYAYAVNVASCLAQFKLQ
jgi:hypothetical protein